MPVCYLHIFQYHILIIYI